jgi:hypothetical protein
MKDRSSGMVDELQTLIPFGFAQGGILTSSPQTVRQSALRMTTH